MPGLTKGRNSGLLLSSGSHNTGNRAPLFSTLNKIASFNLSCTCIVCDSFSEKTNTLWSDSVITENSWLVSCAWSPKPRLRAVSLNPISH